MLSPMLVGWLNVLAIKGMDSSLNVEGIYEGVVPVKYETINFRATNLTRHNQMVK